MSGAGAADTARAALVLVDIQNDYFPGGRMELAIADEAGRRAADALRLFRERGWPVVHVRHEALKPGATFFLPGTAGADIHEDVRPLPGEPVVTKHFPNSFRETGLGTQLEAAGTRRLVVAGMMTHMCVDATVRAAFDLGFECTVLKDACATRALALDGRQVAAEDVHAAFLAALGSAYARVVSVAEFAAG